MCAREGQPAYSASLKPPRGDPLGLQEGETWIGRGMFDASLRAQLLCSRRQACFTLTESGLRIECHGINPLLFVVCHSKNVHGTEATPAAELFPLRKGEAMDLADGDQFYFAAMECLLTVVMRRNEVPKVALQPPLQQASETCVEENEENLIENSVADDQQVVEILRAPQYPAEDCCTSDPQRFLLDESVVCANSTQPVPVLCCPDVAGPHEFLAASKPSGRPMVDLCLFSENPRYESLGNDPEDSDSLRLDAYDSLRPVGVSRPGVQQSLRCISPTRGEEVSDAAVGGEDYDRLNECHQIHAGNCVEEALPNNTVDEVLPTTSYGKCHEPIEIGSCFRDVDCGLEAEDLPNVTPASGDRIEQRETEDYNLILSSETVDARSIEDEVLLYEPARGFVGDNVRECDNVRESSRELPNVDMGQGDCDIMHISPVPILRDAVPVRMEIAEHPEASDRAFGREDPEISAAAEDESWPDGPVQDMESVIVSVSGYEGVERQTLVKLINKTGAAFTGQLSKANTHLVCWNFRGKKFDRAMKLHKVVLNHQWFEDCLRAGKRLSECPYKLRSGEDVGPLKWKETLPPPVVEQVEPSDGAVNQHRIDHSAFFLDTADQEDQHGQHAMCETASDRMDLPGTSRQAALPNVESGRPGGRKSRRLVKLSVEQRNSVRENPMPPPTGTGRVGESHQGRTGASEEGWYNTRNRKSESSAFMDAGQAHGHDMKRRKSASSILERFRIDEEERGRTQPSAGPDNEFTVINLADDVDEDMRGSGFQMPQSIRAPGIQGTGANINTGKEPQCSQSSQREVACAICLMEAKSPSEGLLGCGHKFCYKCIFTWTIQAVKGPSCPLCKASCDFITRQELDSSGKIDETVVVVGRKEMGSTSGTQRTVVLDAVCIQCANSDTESLLMRCGTCGNRAIHTFCMDPPAPPPWFCPACTQSHHRDSMRLAWNQLLPGPSSTAVHADPEIRPVPSNVRRRNIAQPYMFRRPSRPVSAYRPTLHAELTQNMGPTRRPNVVGQHSLRSWLNYDDSNEGT